MNENIVADKKNKVFALNASKLHFLFSTEKIPNAAVAHSTNTSAYRLSKYTFEKFPFVNTIKTPKNPTQTESIVFFDIFSCRKRIENKTIKIGHVYCSANTSRPCVLAYAK